MKAICLPSGLKLGELLSLPFPNVSRCGAGSPSAFTLIRSVPGFVAGRVHDVPAVARIYRRDVEPCTTHRSAGAALQVQLFYLRTGVGHA